MPKPISVSVSIAKRVKLSHPHSYRHGLRARQSSLSASIFRYYLPSCFPIRFYSSKGTPIPESAEDLGSADSARVLFSSKTLFPSLFFLAPFQGHPFTLDVSSSTSRLRLLRGKLDFCHITPCEAKFCKRNVTSPFDDVKGNACLRSSRNNRPTISEERIMIPYGFLLLRKKLNFRA